jgi:hypothetical protein
MMLGCKSYGGLYKEYTVGTVWVASKATGQKEENEYCSPEIEVPSETVEGEIAQRRPNERVGKTKVSRRRNGQMHLESSRDKGSGM